VAALGLPVLIAAGEAAGEILAALGIGGSAAAVAYGLHELTKSEAKSKPSLVAACQPLETKNGCEPDDCAKATENIKRLLDGDPDTKSIEQRMRELKQDRLQQPWFAPVDPLTGRPGKSNRATRWGHVEHIIDDQRSMSKSIQKYYECGCSDLDSETIFRAGETALTDPLGGL
jgi:hypothetical protein